MKMLISKNPTTPSFARCHFPPSSSFFLLWFLDTVLHMYIRTLQNGPAECYLNSIEACVINIWPDVVSISTSNGNLSEILSLFCNINKSWILFLFTVFPSITCNDMIEICQRTYHKSYTKSWNSENNMIANTVSNIWKTVDLILLDLHHLFNCDAE